MHHTFPIVPAYLLFKALPSTAIVTGLLHGFKIDLGGAFAGYFFADRTYLVHP